MRHFTITIPLYLLYLQSCSCLIPSTKQHSFSRIAPCRAKVEFSDFDEYVGDGANGETLEFSTILETKKIKDLSACQTRQFSLGRDFVLSDYVGQMGFEEVTDWEYRDPDTREVVQPNPFDESKPKRTRNKSGSVVRVFRGEAVGQLGGTLSSKGLDKRLLIKEFTGKLALPLAKAELDSAGKLQSDLLMQQNVSPAMEGEWTETAAARSAKINADNNNIAQLVQALKQSRHLGILGEVNLAELEGNMEPNEFYRALGVPPPGPDAVWIVYEYAGLSTIQAYAQAPEIRRESIPPKRGIFGNVIPPPPLPPFKDRANYVVQGIMKQAIEAVAGMHESGIVHRSLGRSSFVLSSKTMDKREAISPYTTSPSTLSVKMADFGFSIPYQEAAQNEEFRARARSFGLYLEKSDTSLVTTNFAIAEDMHALGFVFMGLLLSSLAELPTSLSPMPATDEDTLQRLLSDIFEKDITQFREYVEAEDVWAKLVEILDKDNEAGWKVLETLFLAREKVASAKDTDQLLSLRGILSNPFFKN